MSIDTSPAGEPSEFAEFLADYFVECEEHLSIARRSLLTLEESLHSPTIDRALLDELFRSFHSLKGLSAMVGFHEAEQLAHQLEAYLGVVRKGRVRIELTGLEMLIEGVTTLEQVIAARRDAAQPPDISILLDRVTRFVPEESERELPNATATPSMAATPTLREKDQVIADKVRDGARAWQITFTPSSELVARGIDVNSVRQKLLSVGEIVHSAPLIGEGSRIEFWFVLVSSASDEQLSAVGGDGLKYAPYLPAGSAEPGQILAPAAKKGGGAGSSTHLTPANVVRVNLQSLDELMRLVGELVLSRARLDDRLRALDAVAPAADVRLLRETTAAIERQLRDLREGVMRVRMVPVREVFARMQFVVRDLTREVGKRVELRFSGEDTQIDKYVVERIMDPLLHLVRNAVSHGLESPDERLAAGKAAEGQLSLRARATGETVVIEVEDDGRGIDVESVLAHARALHLDVPETAGDQASLLDVLCIPGFSTRDCSDRISGRGVGMNVVRNAVEELGGSLTLQSSPGQGTKFEIQLPLTLAITDALIVKAGSERFAVPQVAVREIVRIDPAAVTQIEKNELLTYRNGVLPLLHLSQLFNTVNSDAGEKYALVVGEGVQGIAIVVDRVLGLREIVVRPLADRLVQVPSIAGATELGDGRVVLILDTAGLSRAIRHRSSAKLTPSRPPLVRNSSVPEENHVA